MNTIFGIPMTGIMIALLVLLAVSLVSVAWVAWRRPVIFKLGVRNIPRRRAQTTLIVIGLMLSTAIIAAALGTGDTLNYSASASIYKLLGHTDEVIVASPSIDGRADTAFSTKMPASALAMVEQAVSGDSNVIGVMPMLFETVPVVNVAQGVSEPNVIVSGIDPARLGPFGGLIGVDGKTIDLNALAADGVVLSQKTASKLFAKTGDAIMIFYANQPVPLHVAAIAEDSALSGVLQTGGMGMVVPLARLQAATHQEDSLSLIGIANAGGVRGGVAHSDAVVAKLRASLAGHNLGVDPLKQRVVHDAETASATFTDFFLLMGLFSISAGILLIVLIFTMLAAERRAEMGMERAVGAQRSQLIEQFVAEGIGSALLAGLAGTGIGLLAAVGITATMKSMFGESLPITTYIAPRSLVVAYSLGVVITFAAVAFASWRISHLTIAAAVRDLPEVHISRRKKSELVWAALMMIFGALLIVVGMASDQLFGLYGGLSLLPFGVAFALRYFGARSRLVFSAVGVILLLLWLTPSDIEAPFVDLFGTFNQGLEMFFLSGLFLVLASTILIAQNTDLILAGISRVGGLFRSAPPAVRTAVASPERQSIEPASRSQCSA
jgi:putative ABC transport system permease protein